MWDRTRSVWEDATMAKTFQQMVAEGREGTPMLKPDEVQRRMKDEQGLSG